MKNVHPVYGAGIRTHNLSVCESHPITTKAVLPPNCFNFIPLQLIHTIHLRQLRVNYKRSILVEIESIIFMSKRYTYRSTVQVASRLHIGSYFAQNRYLELFFGKCASKVLDIMMSFSNPQRRNVWVLPDTTAFA